MPQDRDALFAELARLGLETETIEHEAVFTVAQSAALRARIVGGASKNLFLKDRKGRLFLLSTEDDAEIDLRTLHRKLGGQGRLSFGSAELMHEVLGVTPGSVTPFAAINDREGRVTVALARALLDRERVNFHPLENTATTAISAQDLVAFLKATGHDPLIVEL